MILKHLICPHRIRKVPDQFSWVDHRLVREHYIDQCSHGAAALYLFLVTVADAQGLSFWSDLSIKKRLSMDGRQLHNARQELIRIGLIAYQKPFYQALSLDESQVNIRSASGQFQSIGQIFKNIGEGV